MLELINSNSITWSEASDELTANFNSAAMAVDSNGVVTFNENVKIAPGKGINFSAYGSGVGSNLLDDYEEGTFTPEFRGGTTNPTVTAYANQNGRYTKVGNIVSVNGRIGVTTGNYTGGSGAVKVTLPFTNGGVTNTPGIYAGSTGAATTAARPISAVVVLFAEDLFSLYRYGPSVSGEAATWANIGGASIDLYFGFTYEAS